MDLSNLRHEAETGLMETFGEKATHIAAAPGRVNLIGEHIDYCDGFVLPFALEQNIIIAATANDTSIVRIAHPKAVTQ
jgi:galactokinase